MKLIVKYVFLAHILFLRIILDLDKYIFLLQMSIFWGSSWIRVVLHVGVHGKIIHF